jgi:ankyrin repeat protein
MEYGFSSNQEVRDFFDSIKEAYYEKFNPDGPNIEVPEYIQYWQFDHCNISSNIAENIKECRTYLMTACINNKWDRFLDLLYDGANPELVDLRGRTVLYYAVETAMEGNMEFLIHLIKNVKVNINHQDRSEETVLFKPVRLGKIEVIRELLSYGINPNLQNSRNKTPLNIAQETKNQVLISLLNTY